MSGSEGESTENTTVDTWSEEESTSPRGSVDRGRR